MRYNKIWAMAGIVFISILLVMQMFGSLYLKSISPNIDTKEVRGGFIGLNYYPLVIPNSAITRHKGRNVVFLLKKTNNFWYEGTYSSMCFVEIIAQDSDSSAVSADFTNQNFIITKWDKPLTDGMRVFETDG